MTAVPVGVLLDVQDELHELNAIFDWLPGLRELHAVMVEMRGQVSGARCQKVEDGIDRVGSWALKLTGKSLGTVHSAADDEAWMDEADLIDLGAAGDVVLRAVRCRIGRVAALVGLVLKSR
ncbi:MAG: hypothetical protein L0Y42_01960 [Phycisphaerales bacterium]|nr:hypothetical protein [Phycisphaerales bacterium]